MVWPDPAAVAKAIDTSGKMLEVIIQINKKVIELAQNDPKVIVDRLKGYNGIADYVLLDKSMGQGHGMDAYGLIPFARAIRDAFPDLGIVAAGGLGPDSMDLVAPLAAEFPDISIDAQGKLRPSGSALDPVDWNRAEMYLVRAFTLLQ